MAHGERARSGRVGPCGWDFHPDRDPEEHNDQRSDGYSRNRCKNMMCNNFPKHETEDYCRGCMKSVERRGLTMKEATCDQCETILTHTGRCVFPEDEYS